MRPLLAVDWGTSTLHQHLAILPLLAILRGLPPEDARAIGQALHDAGWSLVEVPLNSPDPLSSIATLAQSFPDMLVGAGTVLNAKQVHEVHQAGARLVVSPNFDPRVLEAALALDMVCLPGVFTATEMFAALEAGAHGLKLFPAELAGPAGVKAMRAVLPSSTLLLPVGGVTPDNVGVYRAAGASGLGLGSALYQPGMPVAALQARALAFNAVLRS